MEENDKIKVNSRIKHFDIPSKKRVVDLRAREKNEDNVLEDNRSGNNISQNRTTSQNTTVEKFLEKQNPEIEREKNINNRQQNQFRNKSVPKKIKKNMKLLALGKIFDKAILYLIYFLVFSLPLFVLPFSMEIYEFNKTILLFVISSLAFLIWIAKMILVDRRLTFVKTPLNKPIIAFILLVVISTAFSVDKVSSVLGFYGRFSDSLMVYLSLAMLYFTVVNYATQSAVAKNFTEQNDNSDFNLNNSGSVCSADSNEKDLLPCNYINNLLKIFLASSFVVVVAGLLYSFGFKFIPWQETQFRSFNLVAGSANILGIYLTVVILVAFHYCKGKSFSSSSDFVGKNLISALIIMSVILLAIIDFVLAWIVLAISLIMALIMNSVIHKNTNANYDRKKTFFYPVSIIIISLIFIFSSLSYLKGGNDNNVFSSSIISNSIKNRIVSNNNNQTANNDGFNREVTLDKKTALAVALEGAKKDPVAGIIGSGPGTYIYDFSKFKPVEFNKNAFWNIRFDKAGSEIIEKISTIGILGTLSYALIVFFVIIMFWKRIAERRSLARQFDNSDVDQNNYGDYDDATRGSIFHCYGGSIYIFSAWFALLLFQFLYLESTTTKFLFWLLTAILAGQYVMLLRAKHCGSEIDDSNDVSASNYSLNNFDSSKTNLEYNFFILDLRKEKTAFYPSLAVLIVLFLSFASVYRYQFNFYQAEGEYKGVYLKQNKLLTEHNLSVKKAWEALDENTKELKDAILKNPYYGNYKVYLSYLYSNRMNLAFQQESQKEKSKRDWKKFQEEVKNTDIYARGAVKTSPNNIIFQHKIADTYMAMARIGVTDANKLAIKEYKRAIDLEPTNPTLYTSLGEIYALNYSTIKSKKTVNPAIAEFKKALKLKKNYLQAGLQLGIAYENGKENQKAIAVLNSMGSISRIENSITAGQTVASQNVNVDIAFQLGRIYYNTNKTSEAEDIFLKIIKVNPSYSNARYSLGLIYESKGEKKKALKEFEAVLTLNPKNKNVKDKIDKLKGTSNNQKKEETKTSTPSASLPLTSSTPLSSAPAPSSSSSSNPAPSSSAPAK